ncbi:MAG: hypothetical protein Q8M57_03330 [Nitrosomonas sp.]|nr:hypothetical protein [Nitrosomonas sp.]MDP3280076.1 hypothetical protein [Nitrosomonas sp.]
MSSSEARRIHIEAWQTSGMSQAAYCREHGLNRAYSEIQRSDSTAK